jgi:outer membrane lipoprotein-sorting protein
MLRQESSLGGVNQATIVDIAAKTGYLVNLDERTATKLDLSDYVSQRPSDLASVLPAETKLVGTEAIGGKPVQVYEYKDSSIDDAAARVWIWTERGLPLKLEATVGQGTISTEYTNYKLESQPDSLFQLPPGKRITN